MRLIYLVALIPILVLIAPVAYALSPYDSGFSHGVHDGKDSCLHPGCDWYIVHPGKGFAFHTKQFIEGYVDGFCSVSRSGQGSDADQATFICP